MHPDSPAVRRISSSNDFETMASSMLQSDDDMTKSFGAQIVAASTDSRKRKRYERAAACYLRTVVTRKVLSSGTIKTSRLWNTSWP